MKLGIQLYTVRETLRQDFKGTLRELAKLGYDGVELIPQFGGMEPGELAAFLKGIGLQACGFHAGFKDFSDPSTNLFDYAHAVGTPYISSSCCGDYTKIWRECVKNCRIVGHIAARHNLQFTYHNHHQEFVLVDGIVAQDRIYASTDPEEVKFELDVYWIKKRGADPVEYIRRFTGRLPQIHLKDMAADDGSFTELGCGVIDLPGCIAAAREGDCRWLIYEQDACRRDPLESAAISINCLKTLVGR